MREELDKLLCEKYPKMMVNRNKPMQETCMCWGFDCGDGWFNILDQLMGNIQHHIDWNNKNFEKGYTQYKQVTQVTLDQVKEKFGSTPSSFCASSSRVLALTLVIILMRYSDRSSLVVLLSKTCHAN